MIVPFRPRRVVVKPAKRPTEHPPLGCGKCGSLFVALEPAFVHCRYCGNLSRIPNTSLEAQEVFELRSGLRLAS